jgi:hypothetical protein
MQTEFRCWSHMIGRVSRIDFANSEPQLHFSKALRCETVKNETSFSNLRVRYTSSTSLEYSLHAVSKPTHAHFYKLSNPHTVVPPWLIGGDISFLIGNLRHPIREHRSSLREFTALG